MAFSSVDATCRRRGHMTSLHVDAAAANMAFAPPYFAVASYRFISTPLSPLMMLEACRHGDEALRLYYLRQIVSI